MRLRKIAFWILGVAAAVPVLLVMVVLAGANTQAGRHLIEHETASLTDGQIMMAGLGGRLPDRLRLAHLTLRDRDGIWLAADGVAFDWSPLRLLGWKAQIDNVSIAHALIVRAPVPAAAAPRTAPAAGGFRLLLPVTVRHIALPHVDIGEKLIGVAAVLRVDGSASLVSLQLGQAQLAATRLDAPATYNVTAAISPSDLTAQMQVREPLGGLIASAAKLPALGGIAIDATMHGPQRNEQVHIAIGAGPLHADLSGLVDMVTRSAALDLRATAPEMHPRPDIAWQSIDVSAHATGSIDAPEAQGHIAVLGLSAGGAAIGALHADLAGTRGKLDLHAVADVIRLPGAQPNLLAGSPLDLTGDIALQEPGRPVHFQMHHTLVSLGGSAVTQGDFRANFTTHVPDMSPLAALAKVDLTGPLTATAQIARHAAATDMEISGSANFMAGQEPLPAVLGATQFSASATLDGQDITVKAVSVAGRAVRADIAGTDLGGQLNLGWHFALSDLSVLSPRAVGALHASGKISGRESGVNLDATIAGEAAPAGFAKAPLQLHLVAENLPQAPNAMMQAHGALLGAPFELAANVQTDTKGVVHAALRQAHWKSLSARAEVALEKNRQLPIGTVNLAVGSLGDFAALSHVDITGALRANFVSEPDRATLTLDGNDFMAGPRRLARLAMVVRASGSDADPLVSARLTADGIDADGITGNAHVTAQGRTTALGVAGALDVDHVQGAPAKASFDALIDGKTRIVVLRSVAAHWKTLALRENGTARIDVGSQISVNRLSLSLNQARFDVAGLVSPRLDLTASMQNLTPDLATPFYPALAGEGEVSVSARLGGTPAAPTGHIQLSGNRLRLKNGAAAGLPAASVRLSADLHGSSATIDGQASAGARLSVRVSGAIPLQPNNAVAVHASGGVDLAMLNPVLEAEGRTLTGKAAFDVTATGPAAAPKITGNALLQGGAFQDFAQGLQLTNMQARIVSDGDTLRVAQFEAAAGPGTIDVAGEVGMRAPGHPVDLRLTARRARPLASDLVTAQFDADLTLRGSLDHELDAAGKILLRKMSINVPDGLPPSVAVLNVRRPGQKPLPQAAPAAAGPAIRLAIVLDAPSNIFVRGHGLDAELGGKLTVKGLATAPQIDGGFDLRRGDFSLAGTSLTFSKGTVSFDGTSVTGKIDPTLNFEADSTQGSVTATLKITGYADAPKIALSSVPELPQDEVLAHLLFGQSLKQLSPLQIAEIGSALAEISGITGSADPLGSIRKGLGLDRLSVGGGTSGAGATVEAGRYVANGVYVGAKQATGGAGGTQAQVQVDLTRHLKLQTTLGTGGGSAQGATPQNDPGSSVGLSYQFEY